VNASDDRSAAALKEKLVRALESKSVFGDKKPNLVILDEIDGADATGSINSIVRVSLKSLSLFEI
jgi:DNA polymerase III delta prime subunit